MKHLISFIDNLKRLDTKRKKGLANDLERRMVDFYRTYPEVKLPRPKNPNLTAKQLRYIFGVLIPEGRIPSKRTFHLRKSINGDIVEKGSQTIVGVFTDGTAPYYQYVFGKKQSAYMKRLRWKSLNQRFQERD